VPGATAPERTGAGSEHWIELGLDEVVVGRTSASIDGGSGQIRQKQKGGFQPSCNLGLETHAN